MIRARRTTAAFLGLVLGFGGSPAGAAEFGRVFTSPSAAPTPGFAVPLAAPSLAPLSSPAVAAPLTAPSLFPAASAALSPLPLAAAFPPAAPLPRARADAPAAADVLRAVAAPSAAPAAARAFDGSFLAASDGELVRGEVSRPADSPRLDPPPAPARTRRAPTRAGVFLRAAAVGVGAGVLAPYLWAVTPAVGALIQFVVAAAPVAAAAGLLLAFRGSRAVVRLASGRTPPRAAPPSRRARVVARALGAALGVALAFVPMLAQRPLVERAHAVMDARKAADAREGAVALPGSGFADMTVKELSATAVGREVLDGLRDRGGVVRMPAFFVSRQASSSAVYEPPDVVLLSASDIESMGVTVENFLRDPAAQKAYVEGHLGTLAHELKHADQARRSPFNRDNGVYLRTNAGRLVASPRGEIGNVMEWEYESYLTEHFLTDERLRIDPGADVSNSDLWQYTAALVDFDDYLRSLDSIGIYAANFHGGSPRYERYMTQVRAGWDAHRVAAHVLLARRALARGELYEARSQLDSARSLAAEKGLPVPVLALPKS